MAMAPNTNDTLQHNTGKGQVRSLITQTAQGVKMNKTINSANITNNNNIWGHVLVLLGVRVVLNLDPQLGEEWPPERQRPGNEGDAREGDRRQHKTLAVKIMSEGKYS